MSTAHQSSPYGGLADPLVMNQIQGMIENATSSRSRLIDGAFDPRRDIDDEAGYPKTENITRDHYRRLYDREPIAARVVEVLPKESWKVQPTIIEDEDPENETPFELAWKELGQSLRGQSWFRDEEGKGNPIWEYLLRADVLSGIGSFGIILLGIDDGLPLNQPAAGINDRGEPSENVADRKLLYLRPLDQSLVEIANSEQDVNSPRFNQPTMYNVSFRDPREGVVGIDPNPLQTAQVHWSRVIHLVDNLGSGEIAGAPRMLHVYNRLMDLLKLYGGSAEMYYRGAFPGFSIETHPQLGGDVVIDSAGLKTQMEDFMNTLQRYVAMSGVSMKSLAPQVEDPTPQIEVQLQAICIVIGIPKRVFMGSERGELSSNQDAKDWNGKLASRQVMYLTPRVIVPFVDRLIMFGVLPKPKNYGVVWPDLESLTEDEQATVALIRTETIAKYVQGDGEALIAPLDFLMRIMKIPQEEVEVILEAVMGAMEDRAEEELEGEERASERMLDEEEAKAQIAEDHQPAVQPQ